MTAETLAPEPQDEAPVALLEEKEEYVPVEVDDKVCRDMLSQLSEEEVEIAARSSYRYFMAVTSKDESAEKPSSAERFRHALAMARRHLVAEKGDQESAIKKLKAAIAYRKEADVDGLRRCFYDLDDPDTKKNYAEYRQHIENIMNAGVSRFVQGFDKKNRAFYIAESRNDTFEEGDWVIKHCVYTLERALAVTERTTNGTEEKVIVVFNYQGYGYANNAPISLAKQLLTVLRDHYPERLEHVFLLDAPLVFRVFYKIIYPFIDKITRKKVKFVTGEAQKQQILTQHVELEEAAPWMLEGGKKDNTLDVKDYLYNIPFDHAFDEEEPSG